MELPGAGIGWVLTFRVAKSYSYLDQASLFYTPLNDFICEKLWRRRLMTATEYSVVYGAISTFRNKAWKLCVLQGMVILHSKTALLHKEKSKKLRHKKIEYK